MLSTMHPLDRPATLDRLHAARERGVLDDEAWARAVEIACEPPPSRAWAAWLYRSGLALGTSMVVAGGVYFVAWNWSGLGRFSRLLVGELAVATASAFALVLGTRSWPGRLAACAAGMLVGPLLAIYSQAYQTGADPWTLFATWAALALPFLLAARLPAGWFAWMLVVDVAIVTWFLDVLDRLRLPGFNAMMLALAAANLAAWLAAEAADGASRRSWLVRAWAAVAFACVTVPSIPTLLFPEETAGSWGWTAVAAAVVGVIAVQATYWRRGRDGFVVAASLACAIALVSSALAYLLVEFSRSDEVFVALALAAAVLAQAVVALGWLRLGLRREAA